MDLLLKKIIFSGVGKSEKELKEAVEKKTFQINVESLEELKRLIEICKSQNQSCRIGVRINPNIDFPSHPYIKTGLKEHKFGLEEEDIPRILEMIRSQHLIQLKGLSMHLGSQIFDLPPLLKAIDYLKNIYNQLKKQRMPLQVMDIGGGLAVNYENPDFNEEKNRLRDFGQSLQRILKDFDGMVVTEPGRLLVARFGILCAQIEYIKKTSQKSFVILNSGMNHFLRPALYGAKHRVLPIEKSSGPQKIYDVVGPICETGDWLAKNYPLPPLKSGGWLAIADTGAYGFVMSNQYNLQVPVKEICFDQGKQIN